MSRPTKPLTINNAITRGFRELRDVLADVQEIADDIEERLSSPGEYIESLEHCTKSLNNILRGESELESALVMLGAHGQMLTTYTPKRPKRGVSLEECISDAETLFDHARIALTSVNNGWTSPRHDADGHRVKSTLENALGMLTDALEVLGDIGPHSDLVAIPGWFTAYQQFVGELMY